MLHNIQDKQSKLEIGLQKMSIENDEKFAKVEASQSETHIEIEMIKRKINDMNAMAIAKGEV